MVVLQPLPKKQLSCHAEPNTMTASHMKRKKYKYKHKCGNEDCNGKISLDWSASPPVRTEWIFFFFYIAMTMAWNELVNGKITTAQRLLLVADYVPPAPLPC